MNGVRAVINDHWAALDAAPPGAAWMTSALPVESSGSPVLCALGPDRRRHLLIPIQSSRTVQSDVRAAAVHLVPLTLATMSGPESSDAAQYADLTLHRHDLSDIFTGLCADVVAMLAADPADPLTVVSQVLDGWHELLRSGGSLGIEQLAGLYAELTVLNELLDHAPDLIDAWKGPLRSPQDFVSGSRAVEVKATAAAEGRTVRIHGIDQLTPPAGGSLMLRWMRLNTSDAAGLSVPELVDSTARRLSRPRTFWQLLARSGYFTADRDRYGGIRFTVAEGASYRVTDDFPRIVPNSLVGGVPPGVKDLRYTVDLHFGPPPMEETEVVTFLKSMAMR